MRIDNPMAHRSQQEVAEIMTARGHPMTRAAVSQTERKALRKLLFALRRDGVCEPGDLIDSENPLPLNTAHRANSTEYLTCDESQMESES